MLVLTLKNFSKQLQVRERHERPNHFRFEQLNGRRKANCIRMGNGSRFDERTIFVDTSSSRPHPVHRGGHKESDRQITRLSIYESLRKMQILVGNPYPQLGDNFRLNLNIMLTKISILLRDSSPIL